jgi:hypothetical protein
MKRKLLLTVCTVIYKEYFAYLPMDTKNFLRKATQEVFLLHLYSNDHFILLATNKMCILEKACANFPVLISANLQE